MGSEDYPAYQKWVKITEWVIDTASKYPKSERFTLANRIVNHSLEIAEKLVEAIYAKDKLDILVSINLYMEKIRFLFRLSVNKKFISIKQYEFICEETYVFGKMIGGWIKNEKSRKFV